MRTKSILLGAAVLAAGVASSMAQNVYSVNVVGYINVPLAGVPTANQNSGSFNLIANPLDASNGGANPGGNTLSNLFQNANLGDEYLQWNGVNSFNIATYLFGWSPNFTVSPGSAGFYQTTTPYTNTFAGTVLQGALTNKIAAGNQFVANQVPVTANADSNGLSATMNAGDEVLLWDNTANNNNGAYHIYTYFGTPGVWSPSAPVINPGQGILLETSAGANWTQNFTVQ